MAIPRFFKDYIKKIYSKWQILQSKIGSVSSLSIDMNSLIHNMAQIIFAYGNGENEERLEYIKDKSYSFLEKELFKAISDELIELVNRVQPRDTIVLAIDGSAPVAKIVQQRQRRYRSTRTVETTSEVVSFDSTSITPGTDFMKRLDEYLRIFIDTQKGITKKGKYRTLEFIPWPQKIIYSSHLVPGEGEHKIMDLMRAGEYNSESKSAHIMYALDADLIMLCMLSPLDNMVIMRESTETRTIYDPSRQQGSGKEEVEDDPEEPGQTKEPGKEIYIELFYIMIDNFKEYIRYELKTETAVNDFVLMSFCIGNDFLPHLPALREVILGMNTLMDTYKKLKLSLTDKNGIIWENMRHFFIQLGQNERQLLIEQAENPYVEQLSIYKNSFKRVKIQQKTHVRGEVNISYRKDFKFEVGRDDWYTNIFQMKGPKQNHEIISRLTGEDLYAEVTNVELIRMVTSYLVGFAWIYRYYTGGLRNVDVYWYYEYYYTPLLSNISYLMEQVSAQDLEQYALVVNPPEKIRETSEDFDETDEEDFESINVVFQMLAVIPRASSYLIPVEVRDLIDHFSMISDFYPTKTILDRGGAPKNKPSEGILLLPFVDFKRLVETVRLTSSFTEIRTKLFMDTNNVSLPADETLLLQLDINQQVKQMFPYRGRGGFRGRGDFRGGRGDFSGGRGDFRGGRGGRGRGDGGRGDGERGGRGRGDGGRGGRGRSDGGRDDGGRGGGRGRGDDTTRGVTRGVTRGAARGTAHVQLPAGFGPKPVAGRVAPKTEVIPSWKQRLIFS